MSNLNVPKCIQLSPAKATKNSDSEDKSLESLPAYQNAELLMLVQTSQEEIEQELHQNRMRELRKELQYLEDTAWKYEPIEKYIGQGPHAQ